MLRAGATQAPEPCRVEYGAASLQKVNRASPGACFDIGKRPRNLERAEREQVEAGVNTNRRTAVSILVGPQHCVGIGGGRRNVSITSMRAGTTSPGGKNLCVCRDLAFCESRSQSDRRRRDEALWRAAEAEVGIDPLSPCLRGKPIKPNTGSTRGETLFASGVLRPNSPAAKSANQMPFRWFKDSLTLLEWLTTRRISRTSRWFFVQPIHTALAATRA